MTRATTGSTGSSPSSSSRRPSRRLGRRAAWAAPVVVAGVAVAAAVVPGVASATDHSQLVPQSAAQLLADVASSDTQALSGTVVQTSRLGLPKLPGEQSSASLDATSLLAGSHTARVWLDGPDRQRLALLGTLAESDVVRSGRDVWTYASDTQKAQHTVLPAEQPETQQATPAQTLTPAAAADRALKAVDPTTVVTTSDKTEVAGRSAYALVLTPRDTRSTVRKVVLAIDGQTHVPLRVQVFGSGTEAAFETGFTDVSFSRPAAQVFRFTPPKGAKVTTSELPGRQAHPDALRQGAAPQDQPQADAGKQPKVVGSGWTSVLVLPAGSSSQLTGQTAGLLGRLTTTLSNGDRLVRTTLVNVLLPQDGRVLVGAVTPEMLQAAAG